MRFILLLLVAMALTISWQSAVLADLSVHHGAVCDKDDQQKDKKTDKKKGGTSDEEPECE